MLIVLISLSGMDPTCRFQNVTTDVGRNSLCSVESWVSITQLWINVGIIYIAVIDRELLVDLLRPVFLALSSVAAAMGKPDLARVFEILSRRSEAHDATTRPTRGARAAKAVAKARPMRSSASGQRAPFNDATMPVIAVNATVVIICILATLAARILAPQEQSPDVLPSPPEKKMLENETPYPIQLPPRILCWNAAVACTGDGTRWTELKTVNPNLRVEAQICLVQGQDILNAPATWQCPATWRVLR